MISMLINQWEYHFVVTFYSCMKVCIWLTINPSYYLLALCLIFSKTYYTQNYVGIPYSAKFWCFPVSTSKLTRQLFKSITKFTDAWWKTMIIRQNIFRQIATIDKSLSIKISPVKISHYMVIIGLGLSLCVEIECVYAYKATLIYIIYVCEWPHLENLPFTTYKWNN